MKALQKTNFKRQDNLEKIVQQNQLFLIPFKGSNRTEHFQTPSEIII